MRRTRPRCWRISSASRYVHGATLLEVLVAILVLSLGLLGVAGLQAASLRYAQGGWARSAIAGALSDFAERVRSNPGASATAYVLATNYATQRNEASQLSESSACDGSACTPDALATEQLRLWRVALNRSMPGAAAFVTGDSSTAYQASIIWFDRARVQGSAAAPTLVPVTTCVGTETGIAARTCCPAAANVPAGGHCTNFTVLP